MVKTYKHLYPKIYDFANLYRAHRRARRGGKRTQPEVAAFEPTLSCAPSPHIQTLRAPVPGAASARVDRIHQ
jgi:hypothetical protein